jgi:hypothetical protein
MESCVIRAAKKLHAAEYHRANIDSETQDLHKMAEEAARKGYTSLARLEQESIAVELDAFLAAARSRIDFISGMLALRWGMDGKTSVRVLLKKADKDSTAPFRDLLTRWREWIDLVTEYRDQCVHYRTLDLTGSYKAESQGENVVATVLPVLVPEKVPWPEKPTTRGRRVTVEVLADIHEMVGIAGVPPHGGIPASNDARTPIESLLSELKHQRIGCVPIGEFSSQHLEKLHQFVSESFRQVSS